ncbi:thioesterase family protein [Metarhizium acridum CQMa 102]|uniref:Thioesterase family protein n=1 Tax=Metarhizium acridum (strain CQMa 102) TaxID=655827 RepID=E9E3S0_METAQ|nr:thioesterase family protein [Metarhizium acridum CQMa 102]EFY89495.1 thioesterase family protein [Metarhizium acridum CQMa 102]
MPAVPAHNVRFDSAANAYLMEYCGIHPPNSPYHPLVAHTSTNFYSSIAYPAVAEVGVRVAKLGNSSVTFELAVFEKGVEGVKAVCRPSKTGMAPGLRRGLEKLYNGHEQLGSKNNKPTCHMRASANSRHCSPSTYSRKPIENPLRNHLTPRSTLVSLLLMPEWVKATKFPRWLGAENATWESAISGTGRECETTLPSRTCVDVEDGNGFGQTAMPPCIHETSALPKKTLVSPVFGANFCRIPPCPRRLGKEKC